MSQDQTKTISDLVQGAMSGRTRSSQIDNVLSAAPDMGMSKAIDTHGTNLSDSEKQVLMNLSSNEVKTLNSVRSKLGSGLNPKADNFIL